MMELWNWTIIRNWFIFRANVVLRFVSHRVFPRTPLLSVRLYCLVLCYCTLSCSLSYGFLRKSSLLCMVWVRVGIAFYTSLGAR